MRTDPALVRAAMSGNAQAFANLLRQHTTLVYGIALATTGRLDMAEEAAQEVFLHAWRSLPTLRDPEHFTAWLRRVARNRCIQLARKESRRRQHVVANTDAVERHGTEPTDPLQAIEDEAALAEALDALKPADREVLVLYYLQERSTEQVAADLGLAPAAVRKRLSRARERLRDGLDERLAFLVLLVPDVRFEEHVLERLQMHPRSRVPRSVWAGGTAAGVLALGALFYARTPDPEPVRELDPLLLEQSDVEPEVAPSPTPGADTATTRRRSRAEQREDRQTQGRITPSLNSVLDVALPVSLDPLFISEPAHERALSLVYDRLFQQQANGSWEGALLASHLQRGRTLQLTLRDDRTWHDGTPVTGEDVCATVRQFHTLETPRARRWAQVVLSCEARGQRATLELARPGPDPLAMASFFVQPAHALGTGVGSGPYAAGLRRRSLRLTAASEDAPIPRLDWHLAGDPYVAQRTVANGGALGTPTTQPPLADPREPELITVPRTSRWLAVLALNPTGTLSEPHLRRAVQHAVDATELCRFLGNVPCIGAGRSSQAGVRMNMRAHQQVAGVWQGVGTLRLATLDEDLDAYWLIELQSQLRSAGFQVQTTRRIDRREAGNFDLVLTRVQRPMWEDPTVLLGDDALHDVHPRLAAAVSQWRTTGDDEALTRLRRTEPQVLHLAQLAELGTWQAGQVQLARWLEDRWRQRSEI